MTWFEIVIAGLAGYRLALLLVVEEGPFLVFERLRDWSWPDGTTGKPFVAGVLSCVWCCSFWATVLAAAAAEIHPITKVLVAVVAATSLPVILDTLRAGSRNSQ